MYKILAPLLILSFVSLHAQENPCDKRWGGWDVALVGNMHRDGVYYSIEYSKCLYGGTCGSPIIALKHTFVQNASINIKLKGFNCEGEPITSSFSTAGNKIPSYQEYKSGGNWHLFKQVTELLRVEVWFEKEGDSYQILIDREKGINEVYVNGKSRATISAENAVKQQKEQDVSNKLKAARSLRLSGDLKGSRRAYEEALQLDPDNTEAKYGLNNLDRSESENQKQEEAKAVAAREEQRKQETADNNYQQHVKNARQHEENGDLNSALSEYKLALSEKPNDAAAKQDIARIEEVIRKKQAQQRVADQKQRNETQLTQTAGYAAGLSGLGALMFQDIKRDANDVNFKKGNIRFNLNCGLATHLAPIVERNDFTAYIGNNVSKSSTSETTNTFTAGIDLGLQFWPFYSPYVGIGLVGNGYGGVFPISGGAFTNLSADAGVQFYGGLEKFKFIASYKGGLRSLGSSSTYTTEITSSETLGSGKASTKRIEFGVRTNLEVWKSYGSLDLAFLLETVEDEDDYIEIPGISLSLAAHNRLKFFAEYFWDYPAIGQPDAGTKNEVRSGMLLQFTVLRMFDFFKQY